MQAYKRIAPASPILLHRQYRIAPGGWAGALLLLGIDNALWECRSSVAIE